MERHSRGYGMKFPGILATTLAFLLTAGCATKIPRGEIDLAVGIDSGPVPIEAPYRDLRQHTRRMRPGRLMHLSVSSDGKSFSFAMAEQHGSPQVFLQESNAVVYKQMTRRNNNLYPRISPDNSSVAYASDRFGSWDILITRIDAPGTVIQVTDDKFQNLAPSWNPAGDKLIYMSLRGGVWMMIMIDWQTRIPTVLGQGMYPDWGAQELITFQTQAPRVGVKIIHPSGRNETSVYFDPAGRHPAVRPRWSPDGLWVVVGIEDGNHVEEYYGNGHSKDLWAVMWNGKIKTQLTGEYSQANEWAPSWGGDRIFYISDTDSTFENIYSFKPYVIDP